MIKLKAKDFESFKMNYINDKSLIKALFMIQVLKIL